LAKNEFNFKNMMCRGVIVVFSCLSTEVNCRLSHAKYRKNPLVLLGLIIIKVNNLK